MTDEELERKLEEMEAEVSRLRDKEQMMKQRLSSAVTGSQLENRLKFYKFSGTLYSFYNKIP
jgi:phage shock protein A